MITAIQECNFIGMRRLMDGYPAWPTTASRTDVQLLRQVNLVPEFDRARGC